jgi:hypothetical protein
MPETLIAWRDRCRQMDSGKIVQPGMAQSKKEIDR